MEPDSISDANLMTRFWELEGLSVNEFRLWRVLWEAQGQGVPAPELIMRVWGSDAVNPHALQTLMSRLRIKLRKRGWLVDKHHLSYNLANSTTDVRRSTRYSLRPEMIDDDEDDEIIEKGGS